MYSLLDMARYALDEFERGLVPFGPRPGVSPEEALIRLPKADGTQMNSISWTVAHVALFWLFVASRRGPPSDTVNRTLAGLGSVGFASGNPEPPKMESALAALRLARESLEDWLPGLDDSVLGIEVQARPEALANMGGNETVGTSIMRIILHTWFHIGEINAMRQMLGHPEVPYIGRMQGLLEWRPEAPELGPFGRDMYRPLDIARFALGEFERGLQELTSEEAVARMQKADATCMNSISWTMGHLAWHWLNLQAMATGGDAPEAVQRFAVGPNADPTPPALDEARNLFAMARQSTGWLETAGPEMLSSVPGQRDGFPPERVATESVGTTLMRVVLHTWFHTGEANAIRQLQGYPEIIYVGRLLGNLEWQPAPD